MSTPSTATATCCNRSRSRWARPPARSAWPQRRRQVHLHERGHGPAAGAARQGRWCSADGDAAVAGEIAARGVALVPQGRRIFKSLTVRENLMVAARKPDAGGTAALDPRHGVRHVPAAARAQRPDGGAPVRRRTADAGHRPGADGQSARAADGRAVGRLWRRRSSPKSWPLSAKLKESGLSIVLVEQNPNLVLRCRRRHRASSTAAASRSPPRPRQVRDGGADLRQHLGVFEPAAPSGNA